MFLALAAMGIVSYTRLPVQRFPSVSFPVVSVAIGYPGAPEEIVAFEKLLNETAPRLSEAQRSKLIAYLRANAPAH